MQPYLKNNVFSNLIELPPLSDNNDYVVKQGNPVASIRMDTGDMNSKHRSGVWRCTPGIFTCVEKGDELQTILNGKLILTEEGGQKQTFLPGDSVVTKKGTTVTWEIVETVDKVFFTHDPDGTD